MRKHATIIALLFLAAAIPAAGQVERYMTKPVYVSGVAQYNDSIIISLLANVGNFVIGAYDIDFIYDQQVLEYQTISQGNSVNLAKPACSQSNGILNINSINSTSSISPVGIINYARITFKVIIQNSTDTTFSIDPISFLDVNFNKIPMSGLSQTIQLNDPNIQPTDTPTTIAPTRTPRPTSTPTNHPTPIPVDIIKKTPTPEKVAPEKNNLIALDDRFEIKYLFDFLEDDLLYADGPITGNFILGGSNNDMLVMLPRITTGGLYGIGRVDGVRWYGVKGNPLILKTFDHNIRLASIVPAGGNTFYILTTSDLDDSISVFKITGPFQAATAVVNWGMH